MRIIYYVVQPQLEDIDGFKETNGWKDVSIYQLVGKELESMGSLELHLSEHTEDEILSFILEELDEDEIIKLVQL